MDELPTVTTIVKNYQSSIMKIADELTSIRSLSPRDESIVMVNVGRLQGLAQGMDFYIQSLTIQDNKISKGELPKLFGFQPPDILQEKNNDDTP